jgi:hypothetical protein
MDCTSINYWAVIVAALSSFALGALWYSPLLFAKTWQKELGFTDEYLKSGNMPKIFGLSLVVAIIMSYGIALFVNNHPGEVMDWKTGLHIGALLGVLFVATSMAMNYLYQRKSFTLWAIDAGYQVVFMAMMGAIIGAWQ